MNTNWWLLTLKTVLKDLKTDAQQGLSQQEAAERLKTYGPNSIAEPRMISAFKLLIHQLWNVITLILLVAVAIAWFIGARVDAVVILSIVLINTVIGFVQEYGAEQSLAALRRMTKPLAQVIRDGDEVSVASRELVPGDIVVLEAGDIVPADGRIVVSHELGVDEASLTGESIPVTKRHQVLPEDQYTVGDLVNMAFMGTMVVRGRGLMVVTETGAQTKFGQIAQMIAETKERETTLQRQLKHVGYLLIGCSGLLAAVILGTGYLQGTPLLVLLFTSLSIFIAAVPEGLPAVITVALARGVKRMAKRNALIRRLASVETLGSISVICTDKTGTITQNSMTVTTIYAGGSWYEVTGRGVTPEGNILHEGEPLELEQENDLQAALLVNVLCTDAELLATKKGWIIDGDPTEGALLTVAGKAGLLKDDLEKEFPLIKENPFDSHRQSMSILRKAPTGARLFVKGAGDVIIANSSARLHEGTVVPLTDKDRREIEQINSGLAARALRVIAVAYKDGPEESFKNNETDETDLVFIGFMAMIDPPRPEVKQALYQAEQAGIHTIMLTGDHRDTARAIALSVGLISDDEGVLTGKEIARLSDEELIKQLYNVPVYARVSIEHKMRIVKLLKQAGERVAMTGDGVNDAPALKMADIGIAMGITGTDVAKEASDMIITDDNYASIVAAIEEGRGTYESLVKFTRYMLATNLAELFTLLWGTLITFLQVPGFPLVSLVPVQLLWINLVTDGIPAIALVFDPLHSGLMHKKPAVFSESLVSKRQLEYLFSIGFMLSLGVVVSYWYGALYSPAVAQTMAFTTVVLLIFIQLFAVRAEFALPFFSNPLVFSSVGLSLVLHLLLIYVPFLQDLFHTVPLQAIHWLVMMGITVVTWVSYLVIQKLFSLLFRN